MVSLRYYLLHLYIGAGLDSSIVPRGTIYYFLPFTFNRYMSDEYSLVLKAERLESSPW